MYLLSHRHCCRWKSKSPTPPICFRFIVSQWTQPPHVFPPVQPHVVAILILQITFFTWLHDQNHGCLLPVPLEQYIRAFGRVCVFLREYSYLYTICLSFPFPSGICENLLRPWPCSRHRDRTVSALPRGCRNALPVKYISSQT